MMYMYNYTYSRSKVETQKATETGDIWTGMETRRGDVWTGMETGRSDVWTGMETERGEGEGWTAMETERDVEVRSKGEQGRSEREGGQRESPLQLSSNNEEPRNLAGQNTLQHSLA